MIDAKALLDRFLGPSPAPGSAAPGPSAGAGAGGGLADTARDLWSRSGGLGGFAGGAAAGGLLGVLLAGKGGKVLSHGGAALVGALAHRAWQNWQSGQAPATAAPAQEGAAVDPRFQPGATPAAGGEPFELSLIRAMIGAAQADGHIDEAERGRIFAQVERAGLDAEAKAFVFDTLAARVGVSEVAAAAGTPEQAAELYLVSKLVLEVDGPVERAYLQALGHRLRLQPDLIAHLDRQVEAAGDRRLEAGQGAAGP